MSTANIPPARTLAAEPAGQVAATDPAAGAAVAAPDAAATAQRLNDELLRQTILANTHDLLDEYEEGHQPIVDTGAGIRAAEVHLMEHLRDHPDLRSDPQWDCWYEGLDSGDLDNPHVNPDHAAWDNPNFDPDYDTWDADADADGA